MGTQAGSRLQVMPFAPGMKTASRAGELTASEQGVDRG
jgi:hypothetical protein